MFEIYLQRYVFFTLYPNLFVLVTENFCNRKIRYKDKANVVRKYMLGMVFVNFSVSLQRDSSLLECCKVRTTNKNSNNDSKTTQ